MTSQGPNYAGAVGTNSWTNPSNAVGSEEVNCATTSAIVSGFWKTFGFAIPSGTTITGIKVETKASKTVTQTASVTVNIGKNESTLGTEKAAQALTNLACGASQPIQTWGADGDLWGLSWTYGEVNSASFCVRVSSVQARAKALNWIRVTVYYTTPVTVERTPSESLGSVNDSVAVAVIRAVPVSEPSISVSDSVERSAVRAVGLSEPSIAVSDLASYNVMRDRSPSETLGPVSDSVALAVTRAVSVAEPPISVNDVVERALVLMRSLSESLGNVADSPETSLVRDVSILETPITFSDSIAEEVTRSVSVLEPSIGVSDAATYSLLRDRSLVESMGPVGDSTSFTLQRSAEVSEPPISVLDSVAYTLLRVRSLSEPLGSLVESVDIAITRSVSISEPPISVSDSVMAEKALIVERGVLEALGPVTDSTLVEIEGSIVERFVLENIGLLVDLVLAEGGRPSFRPRVHRIYWDDLYYVRHTKGSRATRSL